MMQYFKYFFKVFISTLMYYLGGLLLLKLLYRKTAVLLILNYHNFSKYNNYKIKRGNILETDYSDNFEKQIHFYKKHFNFCYPEDFFSGKCAKGINVLITFDDGYRDNYDIALPILKKHNTATVFFITTDVVSKNDFLLHDKIRYLTQNKLIPFSYNDLPIKMYNGERNYDVNDIDFINSTFEKHKPYKRKMLNNEEIQAIVNSGFKVGNHTHKHLALSFYNHKIQQEDIQQANNILKSIIGNLPTHFAYPNGLSNEETIRTLKELDFQYAYTINGGFNNQSTNKLKLLRIGINVSDTISAILLKLLVYTTFKKGKI